MECKLVICVSKLVVCVPFTLLCSRVRHCVHWQTSLCLYSAFIHTLPADNPSTTCLHPCIVPRLSFLAQPDVSPGLHISTSPCLHVSMSCPIAHHRTHIQTTIRQPLRAPASPHEAPHRDRDTVLPDRRRLPRCPGHRTVFRYPHTRIQPRDHPRVLQRQQQRHQRQQRWRRRWQPWWQRCRWWQWWWWWW